MCYIQWKDGIIKANSITIIEEIKKLPLYQQERIYSYLEEMLLLGSQVGYITQEAKEFRFIKEKVCLHCGAGTISRNGKYNAKQRCLCKSCKKTFTDFTNSATYKSKKTLDMWLIYTRCMINGYSIRKCVSVAKIVYSCDAVHIKYPLTKQIT